MRLAAFCMRGQRSTHVVNLSTYDVIFLPFVSAQHCPGVGRRWRSVTNDQGN